MCGVWQVSQRKLAPAVQAAELPLVIIIICWHQRWKKNVVKSLSAMETHHR